MWFVCKDYKDDRVFKDSKDNKVSKDEGPFTIYEVLFTKDHLPFAKE